MNAPSFASSFSGFRFEVVAQEASAVMEVRQTSFANLVISTPYIRAVTADDFLSVSRSKSSCRSFNILFVLI
jgi:hypothetical protein